VNGLVYHHEVRKVFSQWPQCSDQGSFIAKISAAELIFYKSALQARRRDRSETKASRNAQSLWTRDI
jgi:hypothetical protein